MRARQPDDTGYAKSGGMQIYYEVHGDGPATLLFMPPWTLVYSRVWKLQVPYLARHFRVIVYDGRGNGKSSRPIEASAYTLQAYVDDALAVLDATRTRSAAVAGFSLGGMPLAMLAVHHPERVDGAIFIAPVSPLGEQAPRNAVKWDEPLPTSEGWEKHNKYYWKRAYADWLDFFAHKLFTEARSTKGIEDAIAWGSETNADVLIATYEAPRCDGAPPVDKTKALDYYARIACPVLVIHGTDDAVIPYSSGAGVAAATGGALATIEGAGHVPHARHPVKVNLLIRAFMDDVVVPRYTSTASKFANMSEHSGSVPIGT
ncbi:MAG: alpha/beta hydrolase [Candidatus Eremiobacteraeota bacterium]|nr:alpha/beta hydrolase [Candidatus Eremiobacteraeota bacterium]